LRTTKWIKLLSLDLIVALVICILSILALTIIINEFIIEREELFDSKVFAWISQFQSPVTTKLALMMSFFGTPYFLIPPYLVLIIVFIRQGKKSDAIIIAVLAVVSSLCGWVLKEYFQRSRPSSPLVKQVSGYSFPSGHSLAGFTICGIVIYIIHRSQMRGPYKMLLSLLVAIFGLLIALSRIYLQVHFASDVLASFFVTIVWLSLTFICHRLLKTNL